MFGAWLGLYLFLRKVCMAKRMAILLGWIIAWSFASPVFVPFYTLGVDSKAVILNLSGLELNNKRYLSCYLLT